MDADELVRALARDRWARILAKAERCPIRLQDTFASYSTEWSYSRYHMTLDISDGAPKG